MIKLPCDINGVECTQQYPGAPKPPGHIGTAVSFHGLPFTGTVLLLYVIIGLAIIAAGVTMRVYSRSKA